MAKLLALMFGLMAALADGAASAAEAPACHTQGFEGSQFTVCEYRAGSDELRLASRGPRGPIGDLLALRTLLGQDARRVAFAMNAGMYDPAQAPLGLFVAAGETVRPLNRAAGTGNFFLMPNGVFWVGADGAAHVEETGAFAAAGRSPVWATQSGPLLVQAGRLNPHVAPNGPSLMIRNGVGVRGKDAVFVISDERVSFGRFARFLRDGLGCPDVLYLDGAVSSLWAPGLRRLDPRRGLGTFVVVLSPAGA